MDVWALLCRSSPGTHRAVCCSCSPGRWGREIVALKEGSYSRASLPSHGVINFLLLFIFVAPPPTPFPHPSKSMVAAAQQISASHLFCKLQIEFPPSLCRAHLSDGVIAFTEPLCSPFRLQRLKYSADAANRAERSLQGAFLSASPLVPAPQAGALSCCSWRGVREPRFPAPLLLLSLLLYRRFGSPLLVCLHFAVQKQPCLSPSCLLAA